MGSLRIAFLAVTAAALFFTAADAGGQSKSSKGSGGGPPPIQMKLEQQGGRVFLRTSRPAVKIGLFEGTENLAAFPGQGKVKFDITPHLPRIEKGKLTVKVSDEKNTWKKSFDVTAAAAKLKNAKRVAAAKKTSKPPEEKGVAEKDAPSAKGTAAPSIPLKIEKIHLDGDRIAVVIANPSGADLGNFDFTGSTLTIEGPGVRGSYPLAKIDPRRRLAKKPYRVGFTSPLVPRSGGSVAAVLRAGAMKTVAKANLSPPSAPAALTGEDIGTGGFGSARRGRRRKGGTPPGGVPIMLAGAGLMITSPVTGDGFLQGDTISLVFRFNDDVEPLAVTEVSIVTGDGEAVHTITPASGVIPPPAQEMTIPVEIPEDLPSAHGYSVSVRTAGEPYGISDPFRIGFILYGPLTVLAPGGVQVSLEGGNRVRHSGETFDVTLTLQVEEAPGFYQPSVYDEGIGFLMGIREPGTTREQTGLWWLIYPRDLVRSDDGRSLTLPVTIHEELPEGEGYVISYAHRDGDHYGDSAPFTIRPAGARPGEIHVSSPAEGDILRTGQSHHVRWTYYDRTGVEGLSHRLTFMRRPYSSAAAAGGSGRRGGRRGAPMRIFETVDVTADCSRAGGNISCFATYAPGTGTNIANFSLRDPDHDYRFRIEALSGGEVVMEAESALFTVLDGDTLGDFSISGYEGLRVSESGHLEANLGFRHGGSFSGTVPVSVDRGYQARWTVEVPLDSSGDFVWTDLGPLAGFARSTDGDRDQGLFGVRINEPQEFYEENRDNNREEALLPLGPAAGGANLEGSYVAGGTIYWQDYEKDWTGKRWCCESIPEIVMRNRGYLPVSGRVEVRQVGTYIIREESELAMAEYHDVELGSYNVSLDPGELYRTNLFLYGSPPTYEPSTIEVHLHGGLADWISPNPKVYEFRYRDVYR